MTVTDNTKAATRVFFPEGMFFPQVNYAPEDETGSGGEGDKAEQNVDPKRDLDDPAGDLYPDLKEGTGEGDDAIEEDGDKSKDKSKGDDKSEDDEDGDKSEDDENGDEDDDKSKDKEVDRTKVPGEKESYALEMPDGVELDTELLDGLAPILREKGFTHEEAQKLADVYIENQTKAAEKVAESWDTTVKDWTGKTKKDKEIGGDKLDESLANANAAIEKYGTKELRQALDNSGLGSHPEMIRLLSRVGTALKDDDVPRPGDGARTAAPNSNAETAEELYGGTTPSKRG